jgi:hypothetical protein
LSSLDNTTTILCREPGREGRREGGRWKFICKDGAVAKFLPATTNLIWQQGF